ncbi:hypothetical protein V8F06_005533 [Rhypophila decipiens]
MARKKSSKLERIITEDDVVSHEVVFSPGHGHLAVYQVVRVTPSICERERKPIAMAVYIDGACRRNGTSYPRASSGVYFGPDIRHNDWGCVSREREQTSICGEIEGLYRAIRILYLEKQPGGNFASVPTAWIFTDCEQLISLVSKIRILQDGKMPKKPDVAITYFQQLDVIARIWDGLEDAGLCLQLELIPRSYNEEADKLANRALDEEEARVDGVLHLTTASDGSHPTSRVTRW